VFLG
jgi:SRSO17 transposase